LLLLYPHDSAQTLTAISLAAADRALLAALSRSLPRPA
jgi:hypothetical protein